MPWLPPYMGSWEELVNAFLHNPFLGSGGGGKLYATHSEAPELRRINRPVASSDPMPAYAGVVTSIIGLASLKEAASRLKDSPAKTALLGGINSSIAGDIDDICPPWPWPGPPPPWGALAIVSALVFTANTLHEGGLQTELRDVATQVLKRSLEPLKSERA